MKEREKERENQSNATFGDVVDALPVLEGVVDVIVDTTAIVKNAVSDVLPELEVLDFLKDKFSIVGEAATEIATKLPKAAIEKIQSFDGGGLSSIAESVADTIKSIDMPDIDFPDLDF